MKNLFKDKFGDLEINTIILFVLIALMIVVGALIVVFKGKDLLTGLKSFFDFLK